ncbi:MAG: HDOD domain-containing protein, partial [Pseudomonadota bacterium]
MMTATATKTSRIPTLENGAAQLLLEIADGDVDMDRIVQLVQISPSIAAKLLSTANSAWSNPVRPVTSVTDACSRLGLNVVRTTTIALAIGQSFDPKRCPAFDAERFWCTSILASRLASELAPRFGVDANTAATAALLNNIGMLWLADSMPEAMSAAFDCAADGDGASLSECLR